MNLLQKNYRQVCLAIALCCLNSVVSVQANSTAKNRNDVYRVLDQLNAGATLPGLDLWVNENSAEPYVNIGDAVYFTMKSDDPAFHTLIYVDSKGGTSIIAPMASSDASNQSGTDYLVFPALNDDCPVYKNNASCFDLGNQLKQAKPVGKDTVYLLSSKQPIASDILGVQSNREIRNLGRDLSAIEKVVRGINDQSTSNPFAVKRYTYAVELATTQYRSRSINFDVKQMEKEISENTQENAEPQSLDFNNINFSWNSDELTVPGRVELDVLGSALVDLQEQNGEFPLVELTGHTDSSGPDVYNANLSAKRAESAKDYLVSEHGIPAEQVFTVGAGESIPVDTNATRDGRAKNRRVEFSLRAQ